MSTRTTPVGLDLVDYPDSDGQPMSDNTLQYRWITTIVGGLESLFDDRPDVFVAGDLLWYPVQGSNTIRVAPDALVVFGRPKGYRGSYKQWCEAGVAPQVVFEVLSPGNTTAEMKRKQEFYQVHGVEEYYLYDPDSNRLQGWLRSQGALVEIPEMNGWESPRLGVRFALSATDLQIFQPDGQPFTTFLETYHCVALARQQAERERERAERERERAERERERAERERERAERECERADQGHEQAERERERADQLAALLRAHGIDLGP